MSDEIPVGKILGEPNSLYHSRDAISSTRLKILGDSALKYWQRFIDKSVPAERTWSLDFGAAFHAAMESDAELRRLCAVNVKFKDYRTQAAQKWRAKQIKAGKLVLSG